MEQDTLGRHLAKRHAFGVRPDVYGCLNWVEEGTLMYPVGKAVALHNLNSNTQRFFEATHRSTGLTAVAVSANKKFIAIAEAGSTPQIQILDSVSQKRRKLLTVPDLGSDRFVAMDFSVDGRHLVTLGGAPQWRLFYWNWERSKPLATTSVVAEFPVDEDAETSTGPTVRSRSKEVVNYASAPVSCVTVCPKDPLLIGLSGFGFMRFYRYVDGTLQTQPFMGYQGERTSNFLTHSWITGDRVVASTQSGELLLIDRGTFVRLLPMPPLVSVQLENPTVLSIVPSKRGFVAGSDQGTAAIYEAQGSDEYVLLFNVHVPTEEAVHTSKKDNELPLAQFQRSANPGGASDGGLGGSLTREASPSTAVRTPKPLFQMNAPTALKSAGASEEGYRQSLTVMKLETATRSDSRRENSVVRLALDHLEETLALVTHNGQILGFNFSEKWNKRAIDDMPKLLHICQSFHVGGIVGVDCSVRRPYLVTSGVDRSVRIWNTQTHRLELCQYFPVQPGPVAMHPNGLYVVVCFPDKVRVMSILWNCLHEHRTLNLRNVTDVKYSVGGQYFAMAHGNLIHLYNSLTCDGLGQLRGHPQKIHSFQWSSTTPYPTDNSMISCSLDGLIINWNVGEMRKETEHSDKRFQYQLIAADDKTVWAVSKPSSALTEVTWKSTLREMDRFCLSGAGPSNISDYEFRESTFTTLLVAPQQRLLFGGTEDGSVKFMSFPLQVSVQDAPVVSHSGKVNRMALSYDETTLYSVGSDGALFILDVREDGRTTQRDVAHYGDEVLVLATDVEDREIAVEGLEQVASKLRTEIEGEEKRRSHEQTTRLRERDEEFKTEIAALEAEYAALYSAKLDQERSFVAVKLEKEAEAAPLLESLEREGQAEVQRLEDECIELQRTLDGCKEQFAKEIDDIVSQQNRELSEEEDRFNDVLSKREELVQKFEKQVQRVQQTNLEARRCLELDTDAELERIRQHNQNDLNSIRERFLHMKGEGAVMRKNAVRMEKEAEVHSNELDILESAKTALTAQLVDLNQRMTQLHTDIDERDAVIGEKEKKIYELKKLNQDLEKHKFVLDYRIRQLKSQMEPRQREIAREHQRINEKNTELETLHNNNIALRQSIEELKSEVAQQQVQIKHTLNHLKDFETYKSRVKTDVGELAPAMQEPAQLREVIERLYQRHVAARDGYRAALVDPKIKEEFFSQIEYLNTSVEALRRKSKADQEQHRGQVSAMMVENLSLIREIHDLRTEITELRNLSVAAADEAKWRSRARHIGGNKLPTTAADRGAPLAKPGGPAGGMAGAAKGPDAPRELEENRTEIKQIRAYTEAMERLLAEHASRPSSRTGRLPPINNDSQDDVSKR